MKKQLFVAAALLAVGAQAQVTGPRIAPAPAPRIFSPPAPATAVPPPSTAVRPPASVVASPSSAFQNIQPPVVNDLPPVVNDTPRLFPQQQIVGPSTGFVGPNSGVFPSTEIGTPSAINPNEADLRARGSFRTNSFVAPPAVGAPADSEIGADAGRLTPPPEVRPIPQPLSAPVERPLGIQDQDRNRMNTTGIKNPPRVVEQPLDRSLSAKIRAQLSATPPPGAPPANFLSPEIVRDLRITSQNGKVLLEGMVETAQQKDLIETRARQVQGVAKIDNRLGVLNESTAIGAPARSQTGSSTNSATSSGQSPANSSDLDDRHSEVAPDK